MSKQKIVNRITATIVAAAALLVITDRASIIGIPQYTFNLIFFIGILPASLAVINPLKTLKPELFNYQEEE